MVGSVTWPVRVTEMREEGRGIAGKGGGGRDDCGTLRMHRKLGGRHRRNATGSQEREEV